jgi:hypothetical protein
LKRDDVGLICLSVDIDFFLSSIRRLDFGLDFDKDDVGLKLISYIENKDRGLVLLI